MRKILLIILVLHLCVTIFSLKEEGVLAVFPPFEKDYVYQIFSDLVASLGIVFLLCYIQVKRTQGSIRNLCIAIIGTAFIGSFSPLIYLLVEKDLFEE